MTHEFSDIANLDKNEQSLAYRNLARSGNPDSAIAYATLVWKDKYKGEVVGSKVPDDEKKLARQEAIDFLMMASTNGDLDCSLKGAYATFKGVHGSNDKILCKTSHQSTITFVTNALKHELSDDEASKLCLMRAMSTKMNQASAEDVVSALECAAAYETTTFALRAKAHLGAYTYDSGDFINAIPLLESFDNITTATLLMLIYKNHIKDNVKCRYYHQRTLDLCRAKADKSQDL